MVSIFYWLNSLSFQKKEQQIFLKIFLLKKQALNVSSANKLSCLISIFQVIIELLSQCIQYNITFLYCFCKSRQCINCVAQLKIHSFYLIFQQICCRSIMYSYPKSISASLRFFSLCFYFILQSRSKYFRQTVVFL